jgi:metal-responsive CopG/Arc/MetJ family transcriptional regulator
MSDNKHTGQQKVPFWLDKDQLEKLDKIIAEYGYTSRVEWFRAMVREEILDYEKMKASQK